MEKRGARVALYGEIMLNPDQCAQLKWLPQMRSSVWVKIKFDEGEINKIHVEEVKKVKDRT